MCPVGVPFEKEPCSLLKHHKIGSIVVNQRIYLKKKIDIADLHNRLNLYP